ncbi:EH signature domain-containing protein [Devosia sp.]|uniref:EH signature domain-containing protein n=1 Tax=Devosia sp. TaxID=1871048 RepID=UPI00262F91EC|nr:EH signature domain-containing protein [Devosia sp.]
MSNNLRDACIGIVRQTGAIAPRLPEMLALQRLGAKLAEMPAMEGSYRPRDPRQVAAEIAGAIRAGKSLSRRQVRQAPWCLWTQETQLAAEADLLLPLLEAIARAERASPFRSLASAYVDSFRAELPGLDATAHCLIQLSKKWGGHWGQLQEEFGLFDPETGPKRLAAAVINEDRSATEILRDRGLQAMGAQGGYARAVTAALLSALARGSEPDHMKRLGKIQRYALSEGGNPLFGEQLPDIAEALLRPFERVSPDNPIRDRFLDLILKLLGDPRLRPGKWMLVPPVLRAIVAGWLTEQSLRQFLDIVDEIAVEHMWKYRRAFWEGVYEHYRSKGLDVQVWVAFGRVGTNRVRATFGRNVSFAELSQSGKYVKPTHAVLLMKVADCLIADWNDNGKCHVWSSADQPGAPRMFDPHYGSNDVQIFTGQGHHETADELTWGHGGSEGLSWQHKIADRLQQLIGIRIPEAVYRLRQ